MVERALFHPPDFRERDENRPSRISWRVVTTEGIELLTQCEDFMLMLAINQRVALVVEHSVTT